MDRKPDRRRFLGTAASLGGLAVLSSFGWDLKVGSTPLPLRAALLGIVRDTEGARLIGREYLKVNPEESNPDKLVALMTHTGPFAPGTLVDAREARNFLQQRIREDFRFRRTVELQGWVLSRTEARLCSLAALG